MAQCGVIFRTAEDYRDHLPCPNCGPAPAATLDSGKREQFATGAQREPRDPAKGRYDLLSRHAVHRLAQLYARGAVKYGASNMRKGIPVFTYLDSGLRHFFQLIAGDTSEDHAAAVIWNLSEYIHTREEIAAGRLPESLLTDV